jgi:hypothetical protein
LAKRDGDIRLFLLLQAAHGFPERNAQRCLVTSSAMSAGQAVGRAQLAASRFRGNGSMALWQELSRDWQILHLPAGEPRVTL